MKRIRIKMIILGILTILLAFSGNSMSQTDTQDTSWMFSDIVDAQFVKSHISVPMPDNIMLIDARPYKGKYIKGHIPGAVNIPFSEFDKKTALLPTDKNALLIYYCEGVKCKLSHKSAKKAQKMGYTNVKVYSKGYPEWISIKGNYGSISVEKLAEQIAGNKAVIIDSRPQKTKFDKSHIPTAISIPFSQFDELSGKLPRDLNTPVIFYCGGLKCRLSHKSAKKAIELGYQDVKIFAKGYPEWKKTYGASVSTVQASKGEVEGSIDIDQFENILTTNPDSIVLIDVRDSDEFAKGSFKTAINIPVEDLEKKIKDFSAEKPIIFACSTGARSGEAFYMAKDIREDLTDVFYVEAQIDFNADGTYQITKPK